MEYEYGMCTHRDRSALHGFNIQLRSHILNESAFVFLHSWQENVCIIPACKTCTESLCSAAIVVLLLATQLRGDFGIIQQIIVLLHGSW